MKNSTQNPSPMLQHKMHFVQLKYDHKNPKTLAALGFKDGDFDGITDIDMGALTLEQTGLLLLEGLSSKIGSALIIGAVKGDFEAVKVYKTVSEAVELIAMSSDELFIACLYAGALEKQSKSKMGGLLEFLDEQMASEAEDK